MTAVVAVVIIAAYPAAVEGSKARDFCNSPAGRSLKCGWASQDEQTASTNQCIWCGTVWAGEPPLSLPTTISEDRSYWQYFGHAISLGCRGRVGVHTVFKITRQPASDVNRECTHARLEDLSYTGPTSRIIRCELQLPAGSEPEEQRALRAQEGPCYICPWCSERGRGGCPRRLGVWYSDSYATVVEGCSDAGALGDDYLPKVAAVAVDPETSLVLAKFEVCGEPPCFDPDYEDRKTRNAGFCSGPSCS